MAERIERRTEGFDESKPTPATPSTREGWDRERHREAIDFHNAQNERAGMKEAARRNQYCPKCRGVVDWKATRCPHCGADIAVELRDYYNFSDFEPPVDRSDVGPILTALLIAAVVVGLAALVIYLVVKALL